jgi:integrase
MASLIPDSETKGCVLRRIEFYPIDGGRRQRLRLGKTTVRDGEEFKRRLEDVIRDLRLRQPHSGNLCEWLNGLPTAIQQRLHKAGLMQSVRQSAQNLGDFLDGLQARTKVKKGTLTAYGHTVRNLKEHYGRSRMMQTIEPQHAQEFKQFLQEPERAYGKRPLAKATVNRRVTLARQFFEAAKKQMLIAENPFEDVVGGHQRNADRLAFVEASSVDKLVASCDSQDWKLLLLLGRYGGLRLPSEIVKLRWQHVDFSRGRILIHSVKTEHHEGKETRYIPMFDELRQPLLDAFAQGPALSDFVIQSPVLRDPDANLRTQFLRLAKRAGISPWVKPFQNMRSTRETELIERLDLKPACAIIGNSEVVALQHYQQLRPLYLESAIERNRAARKEAQNEAHKTAELVGNARKLAETTRNGPDDKSFLIQDFPLGSAEGSLVPTNSMGATGFEPVKAEPADLQSRRHLQITLEKLEFSKTACSKRCAIGQWA